MLTRAFWPLFFIEQFGFLYMAYYFLGPQAKSWGPEGPVGGLLLFFPPLYLLLPAAIVLIGRSASAKLTGTVLLIFPLLFVGLILGNAASVSLQKSRTLVGDDLFAGPSSRALAHAIAAHDLDQVHRLIPLAGDLNHLHGGESFLRFAIAKAAMPGEPSQIVDALLAAGADANHPSGGGEWPLTLAIDKAPQLVEHC